MDFEKITVFVDKKGAIFCIHLYTVSENLYLVKREEFVDTGENYYAEPEDESGNGRRRV